MSDIGNPITAIESEAWVEAVARAICRAENADPGAVCGAPGTSLPPLWTVARDEARAAIRALAETATPGPWQVVTYRTPFAITRYDGTTCSGEHVGRDIATVRHHPQSHAPVPIVTLGIGVTQETPVPFVFIRPEDADYLAAVSPEVVLALLDTIDALRASLAAAEKERDEAAAVAEADKVEIVAWRTRALRAEAALAARKPCEPAAWWAETGTAGASDGCNRPFWLEHEAVAYVRQHGGHVAPLFRSWSCDPADPCAFAQDLASESRTLDVLLDEAKERAKDAEARGERMRAALLGVVKDFDDLILESEGVAGLHLNGDLAPWRELIDGGRFDKWTGGLTEARAALAEQEADRG